MPFVFVAYIAATKYQRLQHSEQDRNAWSPQSLCGPLLLFFPLPHPCPHPTPQQYPKPARPGSHVCQHTTSDQPDVCHAVPACHCACRHSWSTGPAAAAATATATAAAAGNCNQTDCAARRDGQATVGHHHFPQVSPAAERLAALPACWCGLWVKGVVVVSFSFCSTAFRGHALCKVLHKYCIFGCHTHFGCIAASPYTKWLNTDSASYSSLVAATSLNTRSICKLRVISAMAQQSSRAQQVQSMKSRIWMTK